MKVGSLVECIHTFTNRTYSQEVFPVKGFIYTVREFTTYNDMIGIRLEEILNPPLKYLEGSQECSFNIKWFIEIQPPMDINIEELIEQLKPCEIND